MPNYRGYVTQHRYRAFEFHADDDTLAWDHLEQLVDNYQNNQDAFMDMATESGPDEILLEEIEEI